MAATSFNHGVRVIQAGETPRPVELANITSIGALITAPLADADKFPLNEPVHFFTDDLDMKTALGAGGTGRDILDAIEDQGIIASIVVVRVAEGASLVPQTKLEQTIANMVGSTATGTGVHAFKRARGQVGIEPGLLIAPGFTSQRIGLAANPLVVEMEGVADRLKAIIVADAPGTTKEAALLWRNDFTDGKRIYAIDPMVKVLLEGQIVPVVQPASARVAALFVKRDKEKGGPFYSPSNQPILGIVGPSRPISYYDGEQDHEANYLNQNRLATIIENRMLWGNTTLAIDPLKQFVNVVRVEDAIEKSIVKAFRWAMDRNLSVHLGVAIVETVDEFISTLKAGGAILGGKAFFDRSVNSWSDLALGKLRVEYEAEPPAPLQDLIFGAHRNPKFYYERLGGDILDALARNAA